MWGKKRKRGRAKKAEKRAQCAKRLEEVFSCAKTKSTSNLFSPLFSTSVRSFGPQEWSVFSSSFSLSIIKACVSNKIPPKKKNTESTQSTARVGLVHSHVQTHVSASSSFYSFFFVSFESLFFNISRFLFSSLPCGVCIKKKKSLSLSRRLAVRGSLCASVFCVSH